MSDTRVLSIFDHPFFRKAPAFAALVDNDHPTDEHLRACLMEFARYVLGRLDRIEAGAAHTPTEVRPS